MQFIFDDFVPGISNHIAWRAIGKRQVNSTIRRSKLGVLWYCLTSAIVILALSFVYGAIFKNDISDYIPYLGVGYVIWLYVSATLSAATTFWVSKRSYLTEKHIHLTTLVLGDIFHRFKVLQYQSLILIPVMLLVPIENIITFLIMLPLSLLLILVLSVFSFFVLSYVSLVIHDVQHLMQSVIFLLFLTTPILWNAEILPERAQIILFNPVYHSIELFRSPLVDGTIPLNSIIFVSITSVVFLLLSLVLYSYNGSKVAERL